MYVLIVVKALVVMDVMLLFHVIPFLFLCVVSSYISGCKRMYLYFEAVSDHVYFVTLSLSLSLSLLHFKIALVNVRLFIMVV